MKRSDGERTRLEHSIKRIRAHADSIELALSMGGPVGAEDAGGGLVQTASAIAQQLAKLDAYLMTEEDAAAKVMSKKPCKLPPKGWYCTRGEHSTGPCAALPDTGHCNRDDGSSPVGVCGGDHYSCSCECNTCQPPDQERA